MRLTDEELREVLTRAEDIQGSARRVSVTDAEMQRFIESAEEVGFERTAVEQALREHLGLPLKPLNQGDLAFAKSADGKFYVAEVLSAAEDQHRVRFLRGGEHTVALNELRACSFLPGQQVVCPWPWWGPWTCTVQSYEALAKQVIVSDGCSETRTFQISDVWLEALRPTGEAHKSRKRGARALIAIGVSAGAVLGSLITAFLMR